MSTLQPPASGPNTSTDGRQHANGRPISRSRQPYHRRSGSLKLSKDEHPTFKHETSSRSESTESGTEADDEKGLLLKSLPPPPLRTRKGLRGLTPSNLTPATTPLPTPSAFIGQDATIFFGPGARLEQPTSTVASDAKARDIYIRRKKGELLRRSSELVLLLAICFLGCRLAMGSRRFRVWIPELLIFVTIPATLYALHPLLRSFNVYASKRHALRAFYAGFHIPSRFDSGPLIYPVLVPLMVALTLFGHETTYLPVNIVCGLASIPHAVFAPWPGKEFPMFVHWIATTLPLRSSDLSRFLGIASLPFGLKADSSLIMVDNLTLLFPLHEALNETLGFLTTTSLDPSELHLLSTALINLWIFAKSPQAQILKAALWVGGLSIFVTCWQFLSWEVELARIPRWRFSRTPSKTSLTRRLGRAFSAFMKHDDSRVESSDDEVDFRARPLMRVTTVAEVQTSSAHNQTTSKEMNGEITKRTRRNTFSALDEQTKAAAEKKTKRSRLAQAVPISPFLTLTYQQAKLRKLAYASAVYVLAVLIILLPVFSYVSKYALFGHEPIGWAIGYAFGGLAPFRRAIVVRELHDWVLLPSEPPASVNFPIPTLSDSFPSPANVRLIVVGYCLIILTIGITIVVNLTAYVEVDTRRKVFHGVMVAMLLPTIFIDPCFLSLALIIILALFLLLDLFRASQLPPISRPLTHFLAPYTDGRDHRGPVIVSHIFLLIGCAIPLWLSLAGISRIGSGHWRGWETPSRDLGMISGVVCVGMGDAAASLIGRRFGKTKWYWGGGKSLEGSAAFAIAVTIGLFFGYILLRLGGWAAWEGSSYMALPKCAVAGAGASLLESVLTAANDNVVVPIGLWLLVKGLEI